MDKVLIEQYELQMKTAIEQLRELPAHLCTEADLKVLSNMRAASKCLKELRETF